MTPGQGNMPKDSIKVVPGRSKLRVESSNPVPTGNPMHRPSKVKLISPAEAIHLSSGASQMPVSPTSQAKRAKRPSSGSPRYIPALRNLEPQRPVPFRPAFEASRPVPSRPPLQSPRVTPFRPPLESSRSVPARTPLEIPRPVAPCPPFEARSPVTYPRPVPFPAPLESPTSVPACPPFEAPKPVRDFPASEASRGFPARPTFEELRPVSDGPASKALRPRPPQHAADSEREIVCGLQALSGSSQTVKRRTNPSLLRSTIGVQSSTVEPSSPRALEIRKRVKQQGANGTHTVEDVKQQAASATQVVGGDQRKAANATQPVEETVVKVGAGSKDYSYNEVRQSTSDEELLELYLHRPALHPTWKGSIVDSAMSPEFDCEFWAKPASNIRNKADRLSKAMPFVLKAELLPIGRIMNDVFGRTPKLSDIEVYFFPDEKRIERVNGEHTLLFEAMATRDVIINVDIDGTELYICSSKLLDKASQYLIKTQKKAENFLWGFFVPPKHSPALAPDGDVADMDADFEYPTPSVALKLIAETQRDPSVSPGKSNGGVSVPPGFEKKWTPALVKLNVQGTSKHRSNLTGCAGIVRDQSGKWVLGYFRCHQDMPEVLAELLAIYHGLKILWDSGIRRIRLETTSREIVDALTTKSNLFPKPRSYLDRCKNIILRDWECNVYLIREEQNSCAKWLASRVEDQPQGLVFFEYPPRALINLLEKEQASSAFEA